jgi:hypothetical protein
MESMRIAKARPFELHDFRKIPALGWEFWRSDVADCISRQFAVRARQSDVGSRLAIRLAHVM